MLKFTTAIFILIFTLAACISFSDTGINTLVKESSNQRHDKKAILFLKQAGATVADSYHVTVCDNNHKLDKGEVGNTFTVNSNHGQTSLDAASINFAWLGNDTLQIDYDQKLMTFTQEKRVGSTTVIYNPR